MSSMVPGYLSCARNERVLEKYPLRECRSAIRSSAMSSDARRVASQTNGRLSSGPVSTAGKERSSRNAVKHGLCAERFVVADEDAAEFRGLRESVWRDLVPCGALEEALVERIIGTIWRLRRAVRVENEILRRAPIRGALAQVSKFLIPGNDARAGLGWAFESASPATMDRVARYEARLERSLSRALAELDRARASRAERVGGEVEVEGGDFGDGGFVSQSPVSEPSLTDLVVPSPR